MRHCYFMVLMAVLLIFPSIVCADGKFFSTGTPKVNIPDQSAVITFDGKTETLIIDTAFEGSASGEEKLAWVIPLPAVPKVEKRTTGLVPTLRMLCRPRLISENGENLEFIEMGIFALLTIWVFILVARLPLPIFVRIPAVILIPLLIAGLVFIVFEVRGGKASAADVPGMGVTVHAREQIGSYDVATLSAETPNDLFVWLKDNDFLVDEATLPVIESYIQDGWVFVAYKLDDESARDRGRAHPLSFTFPTDEAVYPMRLTGVGNGNLTLDLYVLGTREATVSGMTRERTAFLMQRSEPDAEWDVGRFQSVRGKGPSMPVVHDDFSQVSEGFDVLTKLSATLTPDQMTHDLMISWKDPVPYQSVRYTWALLRQWAYLVGLGAALVSALVLFVYMAVRQWSSKRVGSFPLAWFLFFLFLYGWIFSAQWFAIQFDSPLFSDWEYLGFVVLLISALVVVIWLFPRFRRFKLPIFVLSIFYFICGCLALPAPYLIMKWEEKSWFFIGAGVLCLILGAIALRGEKCPVRWRTIAIFAIVTLVAGGAAFGLTLAATSWNKSTVTVVSRQDIYYVYERIPLILYGKDFWKDQEREYDLVVQDLTLPIEEFRSRVKTALKSGANGNPALNIYTGEPVREENSPGNYTIERVDGFNQLYQYDINGQREEVYWTRDALDHWERRQKATENSE